MFDFINAKNIKEESEKNEALKMGVNHLWIKHIVV